MRHCAYLPLKNQKIGLQMQTKSTWPVNLREPSKLQVVKQMGPTGLTNSSPLSLSLCYPVKLARASMTQPAPDTAPTSWLP